MRILLDTNILLDVLLDRKPFAENAARVWSAVVEKNLDGWISAISVNNLYYISRKLAGEKKARRCISNLLKYFNVSPLSKAILQRSQRPPVLDFEDVIQYRSAESARCDYLISRDKNKFPHGRVKVITPEEFINKFAA